MSNKACILALLVRELPPDIKPLTMGTFKIEIKTIETLGRKKDYIRIDATKGKAKLDIVYFGTTFDVRRTVNGRRSAIASPVGKPFWSWKDVCTHYKAFSTELTAQADIVKTFETKIK